MCTEVGLLAQRPTEDQNGWDFLVEFPSSKASEADDGVPQPRQALVQIKNGLGRCAGCGPSIVGGRAPRQVAVPVVPVHP